MVVKSRNLHITHSSKFLYAGCCVCALIYIILRPAVLNYVKLVSLFLAKERDRTVQ